MELSGLNARLSGSNVEVLCSSGKGRYCVSKTDLASQDVVIAASPYAFSIDGPFVSHVCANCLCDVPSDTPHDIGSTTDANPDIARYCSSACQEQQSLCSPTKCMHCELLSNMRMAVGAMTRNQDSVGRLVISIILRFMLEIGHDGEGDTIDDVLMLQCHPTIYFNDEDHWSKLVDFLVKIPTMVVVPQRVTPFFTRQNMMGIISRIMTNSFSLVDDHGTPVGRALYCRLSYFNHSCKPNCTTVQKGHNITIKTMRSVQKGEELTINYIDTTKSVQSRRQYLYCVYKFWCGCELCKTQLLETQQTQQPHGSLPKQQIIKKPRPARSKPPPTPT